MTIYLNHFEKPEIHSIDILKLIPLFSEGYLFDTLNYSLTQTNINLSDM